MNGEQLSFGALDDPARGGVPRVFEDGGRAYRYISLFSGIEAASVAWAPFGWIPVAFAEIEKFPSAVLAERFPGVPNLGDVTKIDWRKWNGKADIVVGGSPCQSFSIAGLRAGLDDPRGNLMLEYLRACEQIDPEWIVWENVPGVLSSNKGDDFKAFLEAVAELWPRGGVCWRILDAQFFGVAQRRRRVFAVINTRDGRRAEAVLLEPGCLRGDNPTSRAKREELTRTAGIGIGENRGGQGLTAGFAWHVGANTRDIGYAEESSPTVIANGKAPAAISLQTDHMGQNGRNHSVEVSPTLDVASAAPVVCIGSQQPRAELSPTLTSIAESPTQRPVVCQTQYADEMAGTITRRCDGGAGPMAGQNVVCMSDTQANTSVDDETCGTLSAHTRKDPPVVCMEEG